MKETEKKQKVNPKQIKEKENRKQKQKNIKKEKIDYVKAVTNFKFKVSCMLFFFCGSKISKIIKPLGQQMISNIS